MCAIDICNANLESSDLRRFPLVIFDSFMKIVQDTADNVLALIKLRRSFSD